MRLRSYDEVRRLTAYLQTVADWKGGFERRAKRAQLRWEAGTLYANEHDQLIEEGGALLLLMRRLLMSERRGA